MILRKISVQTSRELIVVSRALNYYSGHKGLLWTHREMTSSQGGSSGKKSRSSIAWCRGETVDVAGRSGHTLDTQGR